MSTAANKVVLNTGILYLKMILTVGISLYTTRIVLNALGATDFGIYNLVAGIVAMLSFLNAAMTTSTQRYLSFYLGKDSMEMQKTIFSNSLFLHLCLATLLLVIIEIAGLFFFDGFLNIPIARIEAAKWVYHFMAISVAFSVISVPFIASINAHENLLWVAIVGIVEVLLKLVVALLLYNEVINSDNLEFYGLSTTIIGGISLLIYVTYCLSKYKECSLKLKNTIKKKELVELSSFAGWNLFGAMCGVGRIQGIAVILNLFLGTVVNAAYGIANQVAAQMNFFSATMLRALNPQIMKSEGMGDRQRMLKLSMMASKFGFFLLAVVAIPCIFEMDTILKLWLKNVPEYTVVFCQLVLIGVLMNQLTIGLQSAFQATGRIKVYQIIVGGLLLLNLPVAYFLLKFNHNVYSVIISYIVVEFCACLMRLFLLKRSIIFSIKLYFRKVILVSLVPMLCSILICHLIISLLNDWQYRFAISISISIFVYCLFFYIISMTKEEKKIVNTMFLKIIKKIG